MAYLKFQADQMFTGNDMLGQDNVLITTEDGIVEEIVPVKEAGDDVQRSGGILSPGFINCHCHLELSHMKGLVEERTGLVDFVYKVVTERHHADDEIMAAIANAENEMHANGIVAVGDICNNSLSLPQKERKRLNYYNFIEASGWLPGVSAIRFERAKQLFEQFVATQPAKRISISPHAPYSVSEDLWQLIQPYFKDKTVTIHNQETAFEDEFFTAGTGDFNRMYQMMKIDNSHHQPTNRSSIRSYFGKLASAKNILLVHNTFTKAEDVAFINEQVRESNGQVFFCLCVNANQYIESALPPVELFRKNHCSIVLGTDSLASNWSLSVLDEIRTITRNFPSISVDEILRWATINGAQALQMEDELGSFERGKRPGVIVFNLDFSEPKRLL